MTVLLVLLTFSVFLLIDYFMTRNATVQPAIAPRPHKQPMLARMKPAVVAGFEVPDNMKFHPGHTWAVSETPTLVRVGVDDFAARLIGKPERITLPQRGQWIRQGQKIVSVFRDGSWTELISPIEGSVTDINPAVEGDPSLATKDPYGDGWLLTVNSPDAKTNFRNLMSGTLARRWTEDSALRLHRMMPEQQMVYMQDGGKAVDDLTAGMPTDKWLQITREFFLS
jgi:glycine cleavage system H protein